MSQSLKECSKYSQQLYFAGKRDWNAVKEHHFNGQIDFRTADVLSWLTCMRVCNADEITRQISLKPSQINMSSLIHQTVNFPLNKLCSCVPGSPGTGGWREKN